MSSIVEVNNSKKRGRPPVDTEQVTLRLPQSMLQEIDKLRRVYDDLPSRPEVIRRLLSHQFASGASYFSDSYDSVTVSGTPKPAEYLASATEIKPSPTRYDMRLIEY